MQDKSPKEQDFLYRKAPEYPLKMKSIALWEEEVIYRKTFRK